jgi:hypothetical protein
MKPNASPTSQIAKKNFGLGSPEGHHPLQETETVALGIPKKLTTVEMAACLRISPNTPIAALSRAGHYLGMRPCKLGNGRLLWDADEVSRLLNGENL